MGENAAVSHTSKPQSPLSSHPPNINPSKSFYTNFLYKPALVTVFLVLLPVFPSIAPDFIHQTLHARSWELLQLILVGIAVSYGLFSKKNDDESDKDHGDSKQSYVTKLLQVSSVFDDESESQTIIHEENKAHTLNSQYYREEPVVVVAKQDQIGEITQNKPLLLPVRSLKQRVSSDESGGENDLISNCSRFSSNSRKPINVEVKGLSFGKMDENLEENVVLRSPIPWRSRSGRMEMKENGVEESEVHRIDDLTFARSTRLNSSSSSKNLSAPPTKPINYFSSSPPPAPPPPPPPAPQCLRKSVLSKSNSGFMNKNVPSREKLLRRSVTCVPAEELSESEMEELPRRWDARSESNSMKIQIDGLAKSVQTYRSNELVTGVEGKAMDYETKFVEEKGYAGSTTNNGKSTRVENVMMESSSDEESETEEDDYFNNNDNNNNYKEVETDNDLGPDVDKKADEFIAKFREQIRLQRIESIRRSTAQRAGKTLR